MQNKKDKIINNNGKNKNCQQGLNTGVKSIKVGLKETEGNKTLTAVCIVNDHTVVDF